MILYCKQFVEAVAEALRSVRVEGSDEGLRVHTERVGDYIHLDVEGVEGELYFSVVDTASVQEACTPGRWYCVECDTIFTGVIGRSQIPCINRHDVKKLSEVVWAALCEKYGPVESAPNAPRLVDVSHNELAPIPTGHTYGIARQAGPDTPVHQWKPIQSILAPVPPNAEAFYDLFDAPLKASPPPIPFPGSTWVGLETLVEDSHVRDGGTRELTDTELVSISMVPLANTLHPDWRVVEVNGQPVDMPEHTRQWLVSNGFLPIDADEEE